MKENNRTSYIGADGIPRGDWRRIIGANLAKWNKEQNKTHKED